MHVPMYQRAHRDGVEMYEVGTGGFALSPFRTLSASTFGWQRKKQSLVEIFWDDDEKRQNNWFLFLKSNKCCFRRS